MSNPHVDHAKLQRLELADGLPELSARFCVLDGVVIENLHRANGLRRKRNDGLVDDDFERVDVGCRVADSSCSGHTELVESDIRRSHAIYGGIAASADFRAVGIHHEDLDAHAKSARIRFE